MDTGTISRPDDMPTESPETSDTGTTRQFPSGAMPIWSLLLALAAAIGFVVASFPQPASAAGLYLPGRGVRPMGRAGAYVAAGEGDLNSIWYNPANIGPLDETSLMIDTGVIGTFSRFQRAQRERQNGEFESFPEVSNQAPPRPDPQVLIGGPTGVDGLTWAGGLFAPYAASQKLPRGGPQRYSLVDNSSSAIAFLGLSLAYEFNDSFRIGAGFQNAVSRFELTNVTSGYTGLFGRPEDRDLDIQTKVTVEDFFAPTGNAGLWFAPGDHFQIALSAQLPARIFDRDADIQVRWGSHPVFDGAELSKNSVAGGIPLPFIGRAAFRYAGTDFDVELTGVFEGWSSFDNITVEPKGMEVENVSGIGAIPLAPLSIPKNWRDTFSVRLGGSYQVSPPLTLRAGYTYEVGAVPGSYYTIFNPDGDKHVFGSGLTYAWNDFELDFSAAYYAVENRNIANSKIRQINPIDAENELATVVGNGKYRTAHLIVGSGLTYRF